MDRAQIGSRESTGDKQRSRVVYLGHQVGREKPLLRTHFGFDYESCDYSFGAEKCAWRPSTAEKIKSSDWGTFVGFERKAHGHRGSGLSV